MIIISWMTRFTVLGVKIDLCARCGRACEHVVGRKTRWAGIFWLPLLFLGFEHGMICATCGFWTGIPWRQVRGATKSGFLPLPRSRPGALELLAAAAPENEPPLSSQAVFDRMAINPKKGPWDLYLKAWPLLVAGIIALGVITPMVSPKTSVASGGSTDTPHTCWLDTDNTLAGCRLDNGTIQGRSTAFPTTCYFTEPLLDRQTTLRCTKWGPPATPPPRAGRCPGSGRARTPARAPRAPRRRRDRSGCRRGPPRRRTPSGRRARSTAAIRAATG